MVEKKHVWFKIPEISCFLSNLKFETYHLINKDVITKHL